MHACPALFRFTRYAVSGAVFGAVAMGLMVGGIVPALPLELATLAG